MNKTLILSIEGMTCSNCAKTIEKSLSTLANVKTIKVNAINNSALMETSGDVSEDLIKKAISAVGYKLTNIESL